MKIRITKEFHFEMSHCLNNYNGACKNIHGHSYKLFITLRGEPVQDKESSSFGMVMDFRELKSIVQRNILDIFDHCLVIEKNSPYIKAIESMDIKKYIVDFQPTCENLVLHFKQRIEKLLPKEVELYNIKLYETASSCAEWNKEDNQ